MALSWSEQILPAGALTVPVEMAYLDRSYIHLYLNDVEVNDFTWDSDTLIRFGAALEASTKVTVVRRTARDYLYILFAEGAAFIKENLDTQNTQFLHLAQELVEGRAIDGFFGEINMNGYKITNLGPGTELGDAVNVGQLNTVSDRVTSLEQAIVIDDTTSFPWYTITTTETSTISPPYIFNKGAVFINGVCQTPGYSYDILNNQIHLADPVPTGTHIFARLGQDVLPDDDYATAAQLATAISNAEAAHIGITAAYQAADTALQSSINTKAAKGINSDITALTALSGGITGTVLGSTADTGVVGQVLEVTGAAITLTNAAVANVATLTLPAGEWEVSGALRVVYSATSVTVGGSAGINNVTAALPAWQYQVTKESRTVALTGGFTTITSMRPFIIRSSSAGNAYLVSNINFSTGTATATGHLLARRIR